jgi:ACS family hexuronate transporter-like MFS transporter
VTDRSSSTARWAVVSIFALASTLNYLDRQILAAAAPLIKEEFHLDSAGYGWLVAAFSISYALGSPFAGWFLDRVGIELGMVWSVAMWSLTSAFTGISRGLVSLVGARIFLGGWESAGVPAAGKLNAVYLPPKNRAIGAAMTQIGLAIGGVLSPLLVKWLPGWRQPFFVCAALGLLWIPVWLLARRAVPPWAEVAPQRQKGQLKLLRDPLLITIAVANMFWMGIYTLWSNWTTLYLVQNFNLTVNSVAAFAWFPPVASVLGGFTGGWISQRAMSRGVPAVEARNRAILISAVGCVATLLAPLCPTPFWATLAIAVSYFWVVAGSVNVYTLPVDIWGGERSGIAISTLVFAYGVLQTGISPLIGMAADRVGFTPVCWLVGLAPFVAWLLLRRANGHTLA